MLELHFLPPYSPQLNPDEQVWRNVKERVAKQKALDKVSLRRLIQAALERLQTCHSSCGNLFGIRIALVQYEQTVFIT
jgi:transposase